MDIVTLRITFSLIALCMLVLFYVTTYRVTRAPFCAWWCISLVLFLGAGIAWLLNGSDAQAVANPLGNVLAVAGAQTVWFAARSLRRARPPWRLSAVVLLVTAVAGALDHPATNIWAGGLVFLAGMTLFFALTTYEVWTASRAGDGMSAYSPVTAALTVTSALVAIFYCGRAIAYAVVGPHHHLFTDVFGTTPTTLLTTVLLVSVSHAMGALSQEQLVQDLRHRAERDGLSGLLNREAFGQLADKTVRGIARSAIIICDLDHFKQVNDAHGHRVGDAVITAFSDAIRYAIRSTDLAARFGGEEFVILMPGASTAAATVLTQALSRHLSESEVLPAGQAVTSSYGIAAVEGGIPIGEALQRADEALYRAKSAGRDRAITWAP
ncbi:GGDEF domain-containing protein [Nocardioides sp. Kera G14]|uniref:GGDEF domain-containing protein n=1 Tax=Nocardioides sp. Kera G14 TaxID=2884264 RepID=UPI001D121481|nr:GGDEF domain-containing protein [Nocardioides sp. Kera G14]UDY22711.1 GGDEF domain-containing protein [Nocardioides sp. Kera G14]